MAEFIPPLELETWVINVFAGNAEIFGALSLLFISGLAGFLRMNMIGMFLMLGIFVLMFSGTIGITFLTLFGIIGGLIIGYAIATAFR